MVTYFPQYIQGAIAPEEIAKLAVYLCSDEAKTITGKIYVLMKGKEPFEQIRKPGNVFITVGLQDMRDLRQRQIDAQQDSYFIPATIGTETFWENQLNPLLKSLQDQGKIQNKKVNFLLENLMLGWRSLPLSRELVEKHEDETFSYPSSNPKASLRWRHKKEFYNYFCWLANEGFQYIDPNGGIGLAEFPEEVSTPLKTWYRKQGKQMGAEMVGNQVMIKRNSSKPESLIR